jgi:chemotaxis protein MotB
MLIFVGIKIQLMRLLGVLFVSVCVLGSCVPAKKYNDLLAQEQKCSSELAKFKASSLEFEGIAKDLETRYEQIQKDVVALKQDTSLLGSRFRQLQTQYDKMAIQNDLLERKFDQYRLSGAKETASLQGDLESKNLELQRKEDALQTLEADLMNKQHLLAEREARVNELEELLRRKDDAAYILRTKVANALKSYEGKGLTVVQKNGKIYVNLEAQLLFNSGSTAVETAGKKALIDLAHVLETEKDLEITVEGHTDTDKLASEKSPKNNWELSVLRATAVVEIMVGSSRMNPAQLAASGRSEYIPVDPKDKAKNRRIEIIISPNLNELYKIIAKE